MSRKSDNDSVAGSRALGSVVRLTQEEMRAEIERLLDELETFPVAASDRVVISAITTRLDDGDREITRTQLGALRSIRARVSPTSFI